MQSTKNKRDKAGSHQGRLIGSAPWSLILLHLRERNDSRPPFHPSSIIACPRPVFGRALLSVDLTPLLAGEDSGERRERAVPGACGKSMLAAFFVRRGVCLGYPALRA